MALLLLLHEKPGSTPGGRKSNDVTHTLPALVDDPELGGWFAVRMQIDDLGIGDLLLPAIRTLRLGEPQYAVTDVSHSTAG